MEASGTGLAIASVGHALELIVSPVTSAERAGHTSGQLKRDFEEDANEEPN